MLEVHDLHVTYRNRRVGTLSAVDGVSFSVERGRTFGIVGESGCGKTSIARAVCGLIRAEGRIIVDGHPQHKERSTAVQMVFQDPEASLNPRIPVGWSVAEALKARGVPKHERRAEVEYLFDAVGLNPDGRHRLPGSFSGGQKQRICIARALAAHPSAIVFDEATSSLDVSIQARILDLLTGLQRIHNVAYVFISHDLSLVGYLAHHMAIMRAGEFVESGETERVFAHPRHPYTRELLSAAPTLPEPRPDALFSRRK